MFDRLRARMELTELSKTVSCRTVLFYLDDMYGEYFRDLRLYKIPVDAMTTKYNITFVFDCKNTIRLTIVKGSKITYKISVRLDRLDSDKWYEEYLDAEGSRSEIMEFLLKQEDYIHSIYKQNYYISNMFYGLYKIDKKYTMNSMTYTFKCLSSLSCSYKEGIYTLFRETWLDDNNSYIVGYKFKSSSIASETVKVEYFVGVKENLKYRELEKKVVYDDSIYNYRAVQIATDQILKGFPIEKELQRYFEEEHK